MGAWGVGINQDDTVLDLIGDFKDSLKETKDIELTSKLLIENNKELIDDEDDGPLFWIALAKCQWEYGNLQTEVLKQVIDDFQKENGLERWKEGNGKGYLARKKAIVNFIDKIQQVNVKPKKFPKLIIRKPLFNEGDCLSIKVNDQYYGAAVVVRSDESNPEYGMNLIIATTYWDKVPPKQEDFSKFDWLSLTFGNWKSEIHKFWYIRLGFREYKELIVKVGKTDISQYREISSNSYSHWKTLINLIEKQMENQEGNDKSK